jgi:hypothetical protein
MNFEVPILLLGFNRPDVFEKTLLRILEINPKNLYISLDGPRLNKLSDIENCRKVKDLVENINLIGCKLHLKLSEINLGCKDAPKSAIDWFFTEVEYGIILEDDCFPSLSFFPFCEEMLKKYLDNDRISHISGTNFQYGIWRGVSSYYFSQYTHIWGWATWRRSWKYFDISMKHFETSSRFANNKNKLPFALMEDVYRGTNDIWDIQWFYTNFLHSRLTVIPNINLVQNIGFGDSATHTLGKIYSYIKYTPSGDLLFPLRHNKKMKFNRSADLLISKKVFGNNKLGTHKKYNFILMFYRCISILKTKTVVKNLFKK